MSTLNPARWAQLWRTAAKEVPPPAYFQQLMGRYAEPQRHYHNQQHIADCLTVFDQARACAHHPSMIELAIWFHDAVYDPHAANNEDRSAELAQGWLKQFGADDLVTEAVGRLVLATKHHDASVHVDAGLLVDVDLSILGQPPERFWEYERQIRQEYAWVDKAIFASKRAEILQGFLARKQIYQTAFFFQQLETQARANLNTSVQRLKSGHFD